MSKAADAMTKVAMEGHIAAPKKLLGVRHLQTLLMFLCLAVAYAFRVNLSVAIVTMSKKESTGGFPHYGWDETIKSTVLSSFFWGYVITQVPAGQLGERFGPKYLLTGALFICSIMAVLTPGAADIGGWQLVCATRVIQGLTQGFVFPSVQFLLSKWTPVEERGRLATYVYAGAQVGTIVALAASGPLITSSAGWPSVFYIFGGLGIFWSVLWVLLGADTPDDHKFISEEERNYIKQSQVQNTIPEKKPSAPWLHFATSVPFLATLIAHCTQNWGFWTLLTEMPSYMDSVLSFKISDNSLLSALPYLVMWILSFVFSWASDVLNKKSIISLTVSRKIFNSIGHWGPGIALLVLSFSTASDPMVAVAYLTVAVGLNSAVYLGFQINHIDLSPNFAGTLMGITNGLSNIMSIVAPLIVGFIIEEDKKNKAEEWQPIFLIAAVIYFVGNLFFVIFGKAEIQPWNDLEQHRIPPPDGSPATNEQENRKEDV